jgi:hypothetical protein
MVSLGRSRGRVENEEARERGQNERYVELYRAHQKDPNHARLGTIRTCAHRLEVMVVIGGVNMGAWV